MIYSPWCSTVVTGSFGCDSPAEELSDAADDDEDEFDDDKDEEREGGDVDLDTHIKLRDTEHDDSSVTEGTIEDKNEVGDSGGVMDRRAI